MQREGYRVTAEFEANHWWFRSRRDLFLSQVERAARELRSPGRELRILDYGCGTGHNLAVLSEFGLELDDGVKVTVWDSSADTRFLVLPERPKGTEGWSEEQLMELVTRDSMIGVSKPLEPEAAPA